VEQKKVVIIDDHPHARQGMRELLAQESSLLVVAEGVDGREALHLAQTYEPDIMLMDIQMKEVNGFDATRQIKAHFPHIRIIIVTVSDDVSHLFEALKCGAQGYLLKNLHPSSWLATIRAFLQDEVHLSKELANRMLSEFTRATDHEVSITASSTQKLSELTNREREVLERVADGSSNREIAQELFITENTVKNHLKSIMHKLHVANRVQLVALVLDQKRNL
jgi:two-component system nitrate/nitrite response regulator NarL